MVQGCIGVIDPIFGAGNRGGLLGEFTHGVSICFCETKLYNP